MFKQLFFMLMTFSIAQYSYAKVIELDNMNPDHCRQQILSSKDSNPIIFVYMHNCPYANKLRPVYEQVSDETPDRTFFAFNFKDHDHPAMNYIRTAQFCLGKIPFASPTVSIYDLEEDESGPMIYGELKLGLNGLSTRDDIVRFIKSDQAGLKAFSKTIN